MSLIRQVWLLLAFTVAVGMLGSALVNVDAARDYLEAQLGVKNSDNAQALALTLSQQRGDPAFAELAISAQFDTGHYERIALLAPDGRVLTERRAHAAPIQAPDWFVRALPINSIAGQAQVSDGWRQIGTLQVVSAASFAYSHLWLGTLRSVAWLMSLGLVAGALAALVLQRIRRPLQATVEQARALVERRFMTVPEPRVLELRELSHAMNVMVLRLQGVFSEQGTQLEALRQQAYSDPLTGLAHRSHFMTQLAALSADEDGPRNGALLLLRVRELTALNRELGHAAIDALLRAFARALRHGREQGGDAALAGRLNGSDFALLLPGLDPAQGAPAQRERLQAALAGWPAANVAIGAVAWQAGDTIGALMQRADAALVQAEMQHGYGLALEQAGAADAALPLGEAAWRRALLSALQRGDAQLGSFALVDRTGRLLHLECPLRLRLEAGAPLEAAARWLPWAQRTCLTAEADLLAVALALKQIAHDGQPRGINLAPDSLADSGFVARLREQLQQQPRAAASLWLEVAERAAVERLELLRQLAQQLRPLGVKLGLEHAGERLADIDRLYEAGLDYVKLDASLSLGLAHNERRIDFVRGLVSMLHGLGMQVHAEGVGAAADADALWSCGIDGQTGPWVSAVAAVVATTR